MTRFDTISFEEEVIEGRWLFGSRIVSAAWDFHKEHVTGQSLRHGYSVILFWIEKVGSSSLLPFLFFLTISSPFFWLISAKIAAKEAQPVGCLMLARRGWLPPWHRVRGAKSMLPCRLSLGLHRERGGWHVWVSGLCGVPMAFLIPQCKAERQVMQAAQLMSASGSVGMLSVSKFRLGEGWHTSKISSGEVEDTEVLYSPPLQLTQVVGQGTLLLVGPWQSGRTGRLQRIPRGCASPPPERSFLHLTSRSILKQSSWRRVGEAYLKCKGILRAIFETVFL